MDVTLAIIVVVAIIYLIFMIGIVLFLKKKKSGIRSMFKQTIDPIPEQKFNQKDELNK